MRNACGARNGKLSSPREERMHFCEMCPDGVGEASQNVKIRARLFTAGKGYLEPVCAAMVDEFAAAGAAAAHQTARPRKNNTARS